MPRAPRASFLAAASTKLCGAVAVPALHMQNAQLRRQTVPQQAQQAPRPQAKATTRPQQWLKASPRPQQWLLIGVQGCRLTGFKPLKRLKCLAGRLPA